ncbi:MAG: type II toxin-antitoxin system Phd/YefM family antitoxin [Angustibacter sp.]
MSTLRSELASWIDRVRAGERVVITDRGVPVARLEPVGDEPLLEQLIRDGILTPPQHAGPRLRASDIRPVRAKGGISDLLSEQRRGR